MTKHEIISELAEQGVVETLIKRLVRECHSSLSDLSQEIYLSLLEKEDDYIIKLYNNHELNNFISGMVRNNFFSKTSPFFKNYRRFNSITKPLTNETEKYGSEDE